MLQHISDDGDAETSVYNERHIFLMHAFVSFMLKYLS